MAIVAYSTYIPDVQVYARGCPAPTIVDALRKTCITFFYESLAYRTWVTPFDLTLNTTTYPLTGLFPAQTELAQVTAVKCQGIDVIELTPEQFFAVDPQWPSLTGTQAQYFCLLNTKANMNIIPSPTATVTNAFNMQIAVCPTMASTGMESAFYDEWKDALIDGALSRILRMPETPWYNEKEAEKRHMWYSNAKLMAKIQGSKGNTRVDLTVQMRRWV